MTFGELKIEQTFRLVGLLEIWKKINAAAALNHRLGRMPFNEDTIVEPVVVVPLADLRSVAVGNLFVRINHRGQWIVATTNSTDADYLLDNDKFGIGDIRKWAQEDFNDALAAARSAVDRAKKEAGG